MLLFPSYSTALLYLARLTGGTLLPKRDLTVLPYEHGQNYNCTGRGYHCLSLLGNSSDYQVAAVGDSRGFCTEVNEDAFSGMCIFNTLTGAMHVKAICANKTDTFMDITFSPGTALTAFNATGDVWGQFETIPGDYITAGSSTVEGVDLFVNCASNSSIPPQPNRRRRRSFTASQNTLLF